jgi:pyruvate,water dikinase
MDKKLVCNLAEVGIENVGEVGGKNASLGEMIRNLTPKGIKVPGGFAVTAEGYRYFLRETKLDEFIKKTLDGLDTKNLADLSARAKKVRDAIRKGRFPKDLEEAIVTEYKKLESEYGKNLDVAVRSSATAEDLPGASFAGEQETYLGIRGAKELLVAAKATMASLFTARAISYRVDKGFDHFKVALSVGVEIMVHSGEGASGVMFTLDTESGFKDAIVINGSWGLGEMVVQGKVSPDEYLVAKQLLGKAPKPIIFKKLGEKADKMVYTKNMLGIRPLKVVKTTPKEREKLLQNQVENF